MPGSSSAREYDGDADESNNPVYWFFALYVLYPQAVMRGGGQTGD